MVDWRTARFLLLILLLLAGVVGVVAERRYDLLDSQQLVAWVLHGSGPLRPTASPVPSASPVSTPEGQTGQPVEMRIPPLRVSGPPTPIFE